MASMQGFPSRPSVEQVFGDGSENASSDANSPAVETSPTADASAVDAAAHDTFGSGHLWITEQILGDPLRFRLTDTGFLEFGDRSGVFDHDAVPLRYRAAVRAVREGFTRDAFAAAVDTPESVTFFGVATHARGFAYDLNRIPPFLGTAVHDADRERYLPPDTVRRAFDLVGIPATEPLDKEVRAVHFDPTDYPIPDSQYRDGPAAGVVFHNKAGGSAVRWNTDLASVTDTVTSDSIDTSDPVNALLDDQLTDRHLVRAISSCRKDDDREVREVVDQVLERLAREVPALADETVPPNGSAVRSALAQRVDRHLRETE